MVAINFGDILRNLIDERELSQKQLAFEINIAASTLSSYVRNVREPDFETLKLLAGYFEVSTDYLMGFSPDKAIETTEDEKELLRLYRNLSREHRKIYLEQGRAMAHFSGKSRRK